MWPSLQAQSLSQENNKLRGYIEQLEKEQHSLAMEMVSWQNRWKHTAAKNVRLYQELVHTQQHRAALLDSVSLLLSPFASFCRSAWLQAAALMWIRFPAEMDTARFCSAPCNEWSSPHASCQLFERRTIPSLTCCMPQAQQ